MSDTLEYRGYFGSVTYSSEDELLHGKLLGLRDMVGYDGKDVRSIRRNFRGAVDEYLHFCEAEGREPQLPFQGSFNVRVTPDLHSRVANLAQRKNKKLNAVVKEALELYLQKTS